MESFRFMNLPLELKNKIYFFALVAIEDRFVPRYNQEREVITDTIDVATMHYLPKPINTRHLALNLLLASRSTYDEATLVFYTENHFLFDDKINLHMFIRTIGEKNARHVRNVSIDLQKSGGTHSDASKKAYKASVIELRNNCPRLEYLEVQLCEAVYLPTIDYEELDKNYSEWDIVKALCGLSSERFFAVIFRESLWAEPVQEYLEIKGFVVLWERGGPPRLKLLENMRKRTLDELTS